MALGRSRLLAPFTEETIRTGPFPTLPLTSSVSIASSSDPLDKSLPDSPLLLDELEVLDAEDVLFRTPHSFLVSGIRGGIPAVVETVATRTPPKLEMWREEEEEDEEEEDERGGWALVSAGMGLLKGLPVAEGAREEIVVTVRVVSVEEEGALVSVVEIEVMG